MHKHKFTILLIQLLLIGCIQPSYAQFGQPSSQTKDEFSMQKRFYFGGGLGFGISSYGTNLMIAPLAGYRLSPSFDIGVRLTYNYYRYNDSYFKYTSNNYGAGVFGRYYLFFFNDLFLHAEYEALNYDNIIFKGLNIDLEKERLWVSSVFIGAGYRQWISSRAFVGITVLWNLLDDINSPYSNPIFRIGVGVGI